MRRGGIAPALLAGLLAGCGGGKAVKAPSTAAVKARAEAAHAEKPETAAAPRLQRGQAEERRGKILGPDPEGCTWLEGESSVLVGEQDTRHQARAAAVEQARAAAVQDFLGVEIDSTFMDFQQEGLRGDARLTESILRTTRSGRIVKEQLLEEGFQDIPASDEARACPSCRYHVKLKACVQPRDAAADKGFSVELKLSRVRFVQGDEAKITVTATRDCHVYLYDVYDLGRGQERTDLVVPNDAVTQQALRAGQSWEYPDAQARERGVSLLAQLPHEGDEVSAETIRVVASKEALPREVYDPGDGGWLGVLSRLNRGKAEWTEDAEAFTIYKR